jgi:predicted transcriptional regulator
VPAEPKPDTVTEDQKVFSVRLDPMLIRRVKVHAVLADRSIRSVVSEAMEEYLERHRDEQDEV